MGKVILGMLLGIGAIVLVIVFIGIYASSHGTATSSGDTASPAISVNAAKLWADYHANEVAADNQYKGRRLIVQGRVGSINKDIADEVYVLLSTFNEFESVHADIDSAYQRKAATLQIGQVITVDCQGAGMIIGSPMLKDCSIEPDAPAPQSDAEPQMPSQAEPQSTPEPQQVAAPQTEAAPESQNGNLTPVSSNQAPAATASGAVTLPVLIYQAPVQYPPEALSQKIQGSVQVLLLVDETGNPQNVTVVRSLGSGLDEAAVEAVKHYKFKPAVDRQSGKNVPAQISLNVQCRPD